MDDCLFYFTKIQIPSACQYFYRSEQTTMNYTNRLKEAIENAGSCLCVGLDPDLDRIPDSIKKEFSSKPEQVVSFLKSVIKNTQNHCAAYKPNLGFFEALGGEGLNVFQEVLRYIPSDKIVVADVKRGDISSTAEHYAKAYFENFGVDAITINPLMGFESLEPFLDYPGKCVYTLTLTSNPGANDFLMKPFEDFPTMAAYIASKLAELQQNNATHLGMVIGATKTEHMDEVIRLYPKASLLIPGIGTQGGTVKDLEDALKRHSGIPLINSSRSILYAGEGKPNWKQAVFNKSYKLKEALTSITSTYAS